MGLFSSLLNRITGRGKTAAPAAGVSFTAGTTAQPLTPVERQKLLDSLSVKGQSEEARYTEWQHGSSSWITGLRFNPLIPLAQMKTRSGKVYSFGGMTFGVFKQWIKSPSWGEYFNKHLKGRYTQWQEYVSLGAGIKATASRAMGANIIKELDHQASQGG